MIGALLCGIVYKKTKNIPATLVGEVFGTGILGGFCAYPVAVLFMGKAVPVWHFTHTLFPFWFQP